MSKRKKKQWFHVIDCGYLYKMPRASYKKYLQDGARGPVLAEEYGTLMFTDIVNASKFQTYDFEYELAIIEKEDNPPPPIIHYVLASDPMYTFLCNRTQEGKCTSHQPLVTCSDCRAKM